MIITLKNGNVLDLTNESNITLCINDTDKPYEIDQIGITELHSHIFQAVEDIIAELEEH